jgi:hypothetical protein
LSPVAPVVVAVQPTRKRQQTVTLVIQPMELPMAVPRVRLPVLVRMVAVVVAAVAVTTEVRAAIFLRLVTNGSAREVTAVAT